MELNEYSIEELKELLEEVKVELVEKREEAKEAAKVEKNERAERFKDILEAGDSVSFLYGRENVLCNGVVVRASEKSVTVESEAFAKGKNYVRFDRFVEVLAKAEVEEVVEENLEEAV